MPLDGTWDRKQEKNLSWTRDAMTWRRAENYGTRFKVSSAKESLTHCEDVKTKPQTSTRKNYIRKRER